MLNKISPGQMELSFVPKKIKCLNLYKYWLILMSND